MENKIQELEEKLNQLTELINNINNRLSKQFFLGDRVYTDEYGEGTIVEIDATEFYSLEVKFVLYGHVTFSADGKEYHHQTEPVLKLLK